MLFNVVSGGPNHNVQFRNDSLFCKVPFSFGTEQGHWRVTVAAPNCPVQDVEFDARYTVRKGGCPSYNDNGTYVTWYLSQGLSGRP